MIDIIKSLVVVFNLTVCGILLWIIYICVRDAIAFRRRNGYWL